MDDYSYLGTRSWISNSITKIVIEEGVTHIGAYAFIEASYVTRVDIPTSVTSIGEGAFASCIKMDDVYYAGSPNEWASITFVDDASNPFADSNADNRRMHFYGCTNYSTTLTLEPGIERINDYAFYKMKIANLNIPGSVTYIGRWAFKCKISGQVCINRTTPPTTGYEAFSYTTAAKLYVPSGSQSTYQSAGKPWYRSSYGANDGASSVTGQAVSGTLSASYGSGVTWTLDQDGILTFDASSPSASKSITLAAGGDYPWGSFRRIVHKVRLRGEISALGNALAYHWFIAGLILDQNTVPTCSKYIASTNLTSADSYSSLYNSCNPLLMEVPLSIILNSTESAKLESAPWNDGKWQIAISDKVIIDENEDNSEVLSAIQEKVDAPFTMQFIRSLTNASYNTFCSPIPLTAAQLDGADIRALESSSYNDATEELWLEFSEDPLSAIEAGVPYLIQPSSAISNPTFTNVEPNSIVATASFVNTDHVKFHGVLAPTSLTGGDKNTLFLGAGNELFWPEATGNIKGLRAYFEVKEGSGARRALRARMSMDGHNTPTDFESIQTSAVRSQKVLRDGKLYIMHNGQMYDVQGRRL